MDRSRKVLLVVAVLAVASVGAVAALYSASSGQSAGSKPLPPGCSRPAGGFLIVASSTGYNDSIGQGAPAKPWPVIDVKEGQTVNITVCNTDFQSHGFQVSHYFDSKEETVQPGGVVNVSFVASEAGTFTIYCSIFCSIHVYMQSGQLVVSS